MSGSEVPRVLTSLTEVEVVEALYQGHELAFGTYPLPERLGVAWAQCMLEHERGKAIWCNNLGNITAGARWTGNFYVLHVPPPDPPTLRFRAHGNVDDGGIDYWRVIESLFGSALPYFDLGDAAGAAEELGRLRYFTADVGKYAHAMASLYAEFRRRGLADNVDIGGPSPEEYTIAGRAWRLMDDLDRGASTGLEAIDRIVGKP